MEKNIDLNEILNQFGIDSRITEYGNGHINDTYLTEKPYYILQRINVDVFKNPKELMENIDCVTAFLREKITKEGGDPNRETLTVIPTKDGKHYYEYDKNHVFRAYHFVEGTKTVEEDCTLNDLYQAGIGFGKFQRRLDDFPADKLHDTIPDFHHTPKRVEALKQAIKEDKAGRAASVKSEIEFALKCADSFASMVTDKMENGEIPLRVTHNDTKINNILLDKETGEAVCVIDLDTVMPGSMLYDFGDALRIGGSTAAEDETDISKIHFDKEAFRAFAEGYLKETGAILTDAERSLMAYAPKLITFECGTRFLTDYLNGDTYFKIHYPEHNLDRARNQYQLVREIITMEPELKKIVKGLTKS